MAVLAQFLGSLEVAAPIAFADATLVPLLAPPPHGHLDVDLLEDGVREGRTIVSEIGPGGRVNEILVDHWGPRMLLLLDGEQILGAKQNRVVNASFLVGPGEATAIPVSCVERGRWAWSTRTFDPAEATIAPSIRGRKLTRVTQSLRDKRGYDADQREVWRDVDTFLERNRTMSPTAAYDDGVQGERARIEQRLEDLRPIERQVGLALVRNGAVALLEVFGAPSLFARAWKKVGRGLLVEVRGARAASVEPAALLVRRLLNALGEAAESRERAPGCGESIHAVSERHTVGAIARDGIVFHVVAAAA